MTNPYRSTFAEMLAVLYQQVNRDPEMDGNDLLRQAQALLAQPEPEGPTDEELLRVAATAIAPYEISGITPGEYEPETECVVEAYGSELIAYARAALARFGRPTPQPVADGEVAELCAWLRNNSSGVYRPAARAADLLERLASDNVGLAAAAESAYLDNLSLLDSQND